MRILRTTFATVLALVFAISGATTANADNVTATTPADNSATTMAAVVRQSGNGCGKAEFNYTYQYDGTPYYIEITNGSFSWSSAAQCGPWGQPYAPVLQWKGEVYGTPFDWITLRTARTSSQRYFDPPTYKGSGFNNVRFRVCNWNTNTGTVGTCGTW